MTQLLLLFVTKVSFAHVPLAYVLMVQGIQKVDTFVSTFWGTDQKGIFRAKETFRGLIS